MRIEKGTCASASIAGTKNLHDITVCTVFRYGSHTCGPYMKTTSGMLDLSNGQHTAVASSSPFNLTVYKELVEAILYTGEAK